MKTAVSLLLFSLLLNLINGIEVSRFICFNQDSCLGDVEGVLSLVTLDNDGVALFTFDDEVASTICLTVDNSTCLEVANGSVELVEEVVAPGNFLFVETEVEFSDPVFQFTHLVGDDEECVAVDLSVAECILIVQKDFAEAEEEELDQLVFLVEENEDFPEVENNNNGNNDDNRLGIGVLIFQLMLPLGFIAVITAIVYKYDLVPPRVKLAWQALFRKKGIERNELAEITADARQVENTRAVPRENAGVQDAKKESMSDQL